MAKTQRQSFNTRGTGKRKSKAKDKSKAKPVKKRKLPLSKMKMQIRIMDLPKFKTLIDDFENRLRALEDRVASSNTDEE